MSVGWSSTKFKIFQKIQNEDRLILECWRRMKAERMKAESMKAWKLAEGIKAIGSELKA